MTAPRLFACGRIGPTDAGAGRPLERVVIENATDEEQIRLGRGRYMATMTRYEFVMFVGFDVPPGEIIPVEMLRARRLEAA